VKIICCKSEDAYAEQAFRLRYDVFVNEMGYLIDSADHERGIDRDEIDAFSNIYVVIDEGRVVATARIVYSKDCDLSNLISKELADGWEIYDFFEHFPKSVAVSTKFAILPEYRGTLAAIRLTSKMYQDMLRDGTAFLFSICSPSMIELYQQLAFRFYAPAYADAIGVTIPIVQAVNDWDYMAEIKSPLLKSIGNLKRNADQEKSVDWFYHKFGKNLDVFIRDVKEEEISNAIENHIARSKHAEKDVFFGMSSADMRIVLSECKIMQYRQDQVIFKAGQQEEDLFLLLEGVVQIFAGDSTGVDYVLASGDVFGEEELCQKRRRTCTSLALSDSKIIVISRNIINQLSKKNPELMGQFFMNLGMRRTM
jgi:hypothetical protein